MAYNFLPVERDKLYLMPPRLRYWLPDDHVFHRDLRSELLGRLVDEIVAAGVTRDLHAMDARFSAVGGLDQRVPVGTAKYDLGIGEIGDVSFTTLPSEVLNRFASTEMTTKTSRCSARWGLCDALP